MGPLLRSALFLALLLTGASGVRAAEPLVSGDVRDAAVTEEVAPAVPAIASDAPVTEEVAPAVPAIASDAAVTEKVAPAVPATSTARAPFKPVVTLRLGTTMIRFPGDVIPLATASLSITRLRPFDLELGLGVFIFAGHAYARVGRTFWVSDRRNARGRGWKWEALGQGGIQGLVMGYSEGVFALLGVSLHAALDGSYWVAPHFGLNLRTNVGATLFVVESVALMPEAGISLGLAF